MSSNPDTPPLTSLSRVSHIPIVSSGISTLHSTLSSTPLVRTPYAISLSISSSVSPYVQSASAHYPFAPVLTFGDRAANKTLDIAQQRWPYPFESKPEQMWSDVRSVADCRVVQPAYGVAKSVDQSLTPLVDSFSFVVKKIDADAETKARATDDFQFRRAYALLVVLKDDILHTPNGDNAVFKNIYETLTSLTNQSSELLAAVRSRSEDTASRANNLAHAVLAELDKLSPLVSSLTSNTSTTLKETTSQLRTILASKEDTLAEKIPKVGAAVQGGVKDVIEDIARKVHKVFVDIRASASPESSTPSSASVSTSADSTSTSDSKSVKRAGKRNKNPAQPNGNGPPSSG